MDTRLDSELLLPPLPRYYSREDSVLNNPNIRVMVRNLFETKERFFQRVENAIDEICFSLAGDILESQDKGWWFMDDNE